MAKKKKISENMFDPVEAVEEKEASLPQASEVLNPDVPEKAPAGGGDIPAKYRKFQGGNE